MRVQVVVTDETLRWSVPITGYVSDARVFNALSLAMRAKSEIYLRRSFRMLLD